ncbi:hypothetical protein AMECASPLE_027255 [Ameca splendens]|uniref:Uncharacterized protein n=1 Tax=Ameca splendens TaxID=208324 RepID=A0ABV0ZQ00_9TELE
MTLSLIGYSGFPIKFFILLRILFRAMISRGSRGVPRTELAYVISLQNFFKFGVAPLMLPQQMMAEEITLSTTDLQKICSILLQTLKDLNFFKKAASSFSDLFEDKTCKSRRFEV